MRVPRLPRRALVAATLGALYGLLILPAPETVLGITWHGVAWFVMAAGLLFLHPVSYHGYMFWAILWVVYVAILHGRTGDWLPLLLHLPLPAASLYLLMTSGYREAAAERTQPIGLDEATKNEP